MNLSGGMRARSLKNNPRKQHFISRFLHTVYVETSHAHNQRLKPWSPLNHLLTHVILVRVACGSYIRYMLEPL